MAIRPSGSFRRYLVPGVRPAPTDESLYEELRENRFRSIDDAPIADPSVGWVSTGTFSSTDFRPETVFLGPVARLRMRVDRKRLPSNAVKVRLAEAVNEMGGKVARSAKNELKLEIEKELLSRTVPATALFEVYWRPREEMLLFSSTSAQAHDQFSNLFRHTFGVAPQPASPTPTALTFGGPNVTSDRLLRLAPLAPQLAEA